MNPFAVIAFTLFLALQAFSYPEYLQDYNQPYKKWFKAETEHFTVYYLSGLKEQAEYAAAVGEEAYTGLTEYYGLQLPGKIDFIIDDDDFSNGWALPPRNTIKIWVADLDYYLRGTHNWVRDVVTHELAHVASMTAGQKFRYNIPDIRFGYFDYFNEPVQTSGFSLYSFDILPLWFAEGIAQFESARRGHDSWDAHRDMIMREKALNGTILPLEYMNFGTGRGIDYESGYYNQGFSMVRYIDSVYGEEALKNIIHACSKKGNITFAMAMKDAIGVSSRQLYETWKEHETAKYIDQKNLINNIVMGKKLVADSATPTGYKNLYPQWGHDDQKVYFLSNGPGDAGMAPLSAYSLADTIEKDADRLEMVCPWVTSYFTLSDSDRFVTYSTLNPDFVRGREYTDVFTDSLPKDKFFDNAKLTLFPEKKVNGKRVSKIQNVITHNDHIMQACLNRAGTAIAGVRKMENKNAIVLVDNKNIEKRSLINRFIGPLFQVEWNRYGKNTERVLFEAPLNGAEGFSIFTPRFSPNDSLVVFSYFAGTSRNIGMVDLAGKFTPLAASSADERDPSFGPDGRQVFFSANTGGIFNIYRLDLDSGTVEQITNTVGGAFCPAVSHSGKKIAYSNFDSAGYTIYLADNTPLPNTTPVPVENSDPGIVRPDVGVNFASTARTYFPFFNHVMISPMIVGEEMIAHDPEASNGKAGVKAGGLFWFTDPLEKNSLFLLGLMEVDKGIDWIGSSHGRHFFFNPEYDKEYMVLYENRSFVPTLSLEMDKFLFSENDQFYDVTKEQYSEQNYVIDYMRLRGGMRFQLFSPFRKLHFSLTYSRQNVDFYDIHPKISFEYTMFKELNPSIFWTHLNLSGGGKGWRQEDNIDTRGTYIKAKFDYFRDSIMVDGNSWQESFTIKDNGTLAPNFTYSAHNRLTLDVRRALALPFVPLLTVGGDFLVSAADGPISSFVYPGIFMKSYTFLSDQSNVVFRGRNIGRAEAYLRFPLVRRLRKNAGIMLFDKIYGMAFFEGGVAAGIDPSEAGREDLDAYSRKGRNVEKYMHREENRARVYSASEAEMEQKISDFTERQGAGFVYDNRDKHVIYSALPDDTARGFWNNVSMLQSAAKRYGFGLELRFENYITPGYPFFITLRYSQQLEQGDISGSFKQYFTKNPLFNDNGLLYLNVGFSFDGWDLIDVPEYRNPARLCR
ncbi:MAG: hypothetical protein A2268_00680 [Candidatus Raymondbacteria bacterium RifOxyA12_full_50_37]|uniref:Bacterial surface antigen (D15) domain-containing protein n=1 Tax=Candidatus Raymondbacteria bacterium RIFOXYD12_FULL_49_13 TaxID=1817890 RepID=A0A1F7F9Z4_UNCRA|nr:MAG: hypothetical protein A2268_00680 [Candidatus Raymondbacteria bacterium RifOxyA12_full_50_37]OGJ90045.1 MAG: hypothetical protein A2248_19010 [Candidatus Raymondbacteria bacterium RIFOXYA2_FULL_49_16]OGJ96686.1 MAG: hypothetical protein A2350_01855 [Candidatus Raymondbacteria bacterium RifOxyB12_full_50_8]OGJ96729.1 MAG: hypothetical protein A2453_06135 [Candidatus Raymondbacteria bacterium RIFOXYC2_FULL_50_21]OGK03480.1 MAG: hypothetical protein A2519_15710 [Candidatus Raymondbacteria b